MLKCNKLFMLEYFYNIVFLPLPPVLINVYTVTPDLRPVNDKVV